MRGEVTRLLIESGINVLMARKDGRIAVEVMSVSDSIRDPVQSATDLGKEVLQIKRKLSAIKEFFDNFNLLWNFFKACVSLNDMAIPVPQSGFSKETICGKQLTK